ncbi:MAG: hypothetical protein P4L40_25575 [Terracidiphilus sp.]|nr:hypothetical protein [Terracidiphilus sp.]
MPVRTDAAGAWYGRRTPAATGDCSVEESRAGADAGSAGRAWQQVVCMLMAAHSVDMWRQQA